MLDKSERDVEVIGMNFETFFDNAFSSGIESLAQSLDKAVPDIVINNHAEFTVESTLQEDILTDIFNHLIRNSIDHGLEVSTEREQKHKNPRGSIFINILEQEPGSFEFQIYDDGRGLNLTKIRNLGLNLELISEDADPNEIANLIFHPGFSTAEQVSEVSGRGVGNDAIAELAKKQGDLWG